MNLYQIQEPDEQQEQTVSPGEIAVGIDLGTTNSLVAIAKDGRAEVLEDPSTGSKSIPSAVSFENEGDKVIVGDEALKKPEAITSVKRFMGKGIEDLEASKQFLPFSIHTSSSSRMVNFELEGGVTKNPIEISSEILKALRKQAEQSLRRSVTQAVITVPAHFDDAKRNATKAAAKLAGINVLRLINEPTAAAYAYGLEHKDSGTFLVYDLGGGTFDVSVLKINKGVFQVIATGGDTMLGGDDFDRALLEFLINKENINARLEGSSYRQAIRHVRRVREYLSSHDSWQGELLGETLKITQAELNDSIMPLIKSTLKIVIDVLKGANLSTSDIQEVILVGGATRTPKIKDKITELFGKEPLGHIDPDEIVAIGAALQAEALSVGSDNLLLDVTPLSLGIELMGGIAETIIPRNTPIPAEFSKVYTTHQDNQTGFKIHVIQGESEEVENCRSLAHFELKGIPPMPKGRARVEVLFRVDADGLLTVYAKEQLTEISQEIVVKPSYGLTEEEVISLIKQGLSEQENEKV